MGAGMHGLNGVGPEIAALQYRTYVLPTLTYGLETLVLGSKELAALSAFHRKNLRYLQHLPQSSAIPAIFLLLGIAPIEATLHVTALTLVRNILAAESNSPPALYVRDIITHQSAVCRDGSSSWTSHVKKLLRQYELPTIYSIINNTPNKNAWKETINKSVNTYWTKSLQDEAKQKSTLEHLRLEACTIGQLHPVWQNLSSPLEIQKATIKAQLLIKRYPLTTSPTSGIRTDETCPLCKEEKETTAHFILQCKELHSARRPYLVRVLSRCRQLRISVDCESLTNIILDSNHLPKTDVDHEELCRNMLFKLHNVRTKILGGGSSYPRRDAVKANRI